jgi:hypothetical protein
VPEYPRPCPQDAIDQLHGPAVAFMISRPTSTLGYLTRFVGLGEGSVSWVSSFHGYLSISPSPGPRDFRLGEVSHRRRHLSAGTE